MTIRLVGMSRPQRAPAMNVLLDGQEPGHYSLPPEVLSSAVAVERLAAEEERLRGVLAATSRDAVTRRRERAERLLVDAALSGAPLPLALASEAATAAADHDDAREERDFVMSAWATASRMFAGALDEGTPVIADELDRALDEVLEVAAPHAHHFGAFDFADPTALAAASKDARAAWAVLEPLAARHDALRHSCAALWVITPSDDLARRFEGGGVVVEETGIQQFRHEDGTMTRTSRIGRVLYSPTGHPVQRLLEAVAARQALALAVPA
jgi:hypothetical protein